MTKDLAKKEDNAITEMYKNSVGIGTEEMSQADLNTPILKIIQNNTQNILGKTDGWFYRSDNQQQMDEVDVNFIYVTTQEMENYNKNGMETVKVYYGFYAGTNEPFKMFVRGWGLGAHRQFQTQVARIKGKFKVPMLSLTVRLTSEEQNGIIPESKKPYLVYKPVFTILKNELGDAPLVEMNADRISFLVEAVNRFKEISQGSNILSEKDIDQNDALEEPKAVSESVSKEEDINPSDIPF